MADKFKIFIQVHNKKWKILLWIFSVFSIIKLIGIILDFEAERVVDQLYIENSKGIIRDGSGLTHQKGHKQALVLITGHLETPRVYQDIFDMGQSLDKFDIYAPVTPYHARNLQAAGKFDNKVIYNHFKSYIQKLSKKYDSLTVVGFSYGGLVLSNLLKNKDLPSNIRPILYAPAIYISTNTRFGYYSAVAYKALFRDYCNYDIPPVFSCGFPVYESGDEIARADLEDEISLRYRVIPAIIEMYDLDDNSRNNLKEIETPFKIVMSTDDNRVSYKNLKSDCDKNSLCSMKTFPSGKHVLHFGKWEKDFFNFLKEETIKD